MVRERSEPCERLKFSPDIPLRMPSVDAACPGDVFVPPDTLPVALDCALPGVRLFSAADEGIVAANAIAPTIPSMSGSFMTAWFIRYLLEPAAPPWGSFRDQNWGVRLEFRAVPAWLARTFSEMACPHVF
jgi:hypothetical protein